MRRTLPLILIAVSCAFSQKNTPPPGLVEVTPDTVIATVNGHKLTVGEFERLLPALSPTVQQLSRTQPRQALTEYAIYQLMAREAEKLKVEQDPKVQEKLAEARRQVLANALVARKAEDLKVPDDDIRKYYEANLEALREAQVRIVYVSRGNFTQDLGTGKTTTEPGEKLKQKAEFVAKQARAGKDFADLAKQYSDDKDTAGNGGILNIKIRKGAAGLPPSMTDPILHAAKNDIVGPVEHETGWYIFRVETVGVPEFEAARPDIEKQLKDARLRTYYEQLRKEATVTLDNDGFWQTFIATNKQDGAARQGGAK